MHLLAYAGIALAWFHEIPTGNELVLDHGRGRLLAGRCTSPRSRCWSSSGVCVPVLQLAPLPAARRRGRRGGPRRRLAAHHRARPRPPRAREPGQFFLWRFLDRAARWWLRTRSRSRPRPTATRCGSRSRRSATTPRGSRDVAPGHARPRRGAVRRLHRGRAPTREGAADRRRHRDHADPGDGREMRGDVVVVYRASPRRPRLPRRAGRARGPHRPRRPLRRRRPRTRGRRLLSPEHLRELVPDARRARRLPVRPAGDDGCDRRGTSARAGVPRRHVHVERFALT